MMKEYIEEYFEANFREAAIHEIGHFIPQYIFSKNITSEDLEVRIILYSKSSKWGGNNSNPNLKNLPINIQIAVYYYGCIFQSIYDDSYSVDNEKFESCWSLGNGGDTDHAEVKELLRKVGSSKISVLDEMANSHRSLIMKSIKRKQLVDVLETDIFKKNEEFIEVNIESLVNLNEEIINGLTKITSDYFNSIDKTLRDD